MRNSILFILLFVPLLSGFVGRPEIQDLQDINQDHKIFTAQQENEFSRLDPMVQKKADVFYNEIFFSPWRQEKSRYSLDEIKWEFDKYAKDPGYGKKRKKHPLSWIKDLHANAHLKNYPNEGFPAITVQNSDLRVLPTSDTHLSNPKNCDLPFDNMQNSAVTAGTPIFVSHITDDRKWVLAETHYAIGWIKTIHIAKVDGDFIRQWKTGVYAAIIKDKTPIYDEGKLVFKAQLGSFFPKVGEEGQTTHILLARADGQGKATIKQVAIHRELVAIKPLPLTTVNMAKLANELMNEPYGWGGLNQKRDCSSTLMDLFSPFGIWLPRNSGHQAKRTGVFINLQNLSPEEKEKAILKQGVPYFTLIWLKGHIMLYIGHQEGRALVFHNFWGVKTSDAHGNNGKKVVGRAVITTLYPGQELRDETDPGDIITGIRGMTLLWPPQQGPANLPPWDENGKNSSKAE